MINSKLSNSLKKLLFFFLAALVGCSTLPLDYDGDDVGFAIAAIAAKQGTSFSMYRLHFREIGTEQDNFFLYSQESNFSSSNTDYSNDDEMGAVVTKPLKPGNYEIFNIDSFFNNGMRQNTYSLKNDISIQFAVRPGEVTYLGHFQANKITAQNRFGGEVSAGAFFVVSDQLPKDIEIAAGKEPRLVGANVKNFFEPSDYTAVPGFVLADCL